MPIEGVSGVLAEGEWVVVAGYFDPLTASQAVRLANLKQGRRLFAMVIERSGALERSSALMSTEARVALVAALREVDAVAKAPAESWQQAIPDKLTVEVSADLESDARRSQDFVELVLARQMPGAVPR